MTFFLFGASLTVYQAKASVDGTDLHDLLNTFSYNQILVTQENKPSEVYSSVDFSNAVKLMVDKGVSSLKLWTGDSGNNDLDMEYSLVNLAAFLAQSMQETIQYDACDENNWSLTQEQGSYSAASACGQLGQSYQNYTDDGNCPYSCQVDPNMIQVASTTATWYGAPGPLFCAPRSVIPYAPRWAYAENSKCDGITWNYAQRENYDWLASGNKLAFLQQVIGHMEDQEDAGCRNAYPGQKAGKWTTTGGTCDNSDGFKGCSNPPAPLFGMPARTDVEGCCWWGRGVIQTTGVCNFGKLNAFIGAGAGPDAAFPKADFCKNPDVICDKHADGYDPMLKWIAGFVYWTNDVQETKMCTTKEGSKITYQELLKNFWTEYKKNPSVHSSALNDFINRSSALVNRGCCSAEGTCEGTGEVDARDKRKANFIKALTAFGLVNGGGTVSSTTTPSSATTTEPSPATTTSPSPATTTSPSPATTTTPSPATTTSPSPAPSTTPSPVTTTSSSGTKTCVSLSPSVPDEWCNTNCNHSYPYCPEDFCKCSDGESTSTTPSPTTTSSETTTSSSTTTSSPTSTTSSSISTTPTTTIATTSTTTTTTRSTTTSIATTTPTQSSSSTTTASGIKTCQSLFPSVPDEWCNTNCNHPVPYCPEDYCKCNGGESTTSTTSTSSQTTVSPDQSSTIVPTTTTTAPITSSFPPVSTRAPKSGQGCSEDWNPWAAQLNPSKLSPSSMSADTCNKNAVFMQYYVSWGVYDRGYTVDNIDFDKITHLLFAFYWPTHKCGIESDPWADEDQYGPSNMPKLKALVDENKIPGTKLLLSLGGWTKSGYFSQCGRSSADMKKFIDSAVQVVEKYGFDGLDFDWEYPAYDGDLAGNSKSPRDPVFYVEYVKMARETLDALPLSCKANPVEGCKNYEVTGAFGMGPGAIQAIQWTEMAQYMNYFNLMTYDYYGSWNNFIGPNAPLYASTNPNHAKGFSIEEGLDSLHNGFCQADYAAGYSYRDQSYCVGHNEMNACNSDGRCKWQQCGAENNCASKLVGGLPAYGRTFADNGATGYWQPGGAAGCGSWANGVMDYTQIEQGFPGVEEQWDEELNQPFMISGGTFISYDNPRSITAKMNYFMERGMAGGFFWSFDSDRKHTLTNAALAVAAPCVAAVEEALQQKRSLEARDEGYVIV